MKKLFKELGRAAVVTGAYIVCFQLTYVGLLLLWSITLEDNHIRGECHCDDIWGDICLVLSSLIALFIIYRLFRPCKRRQTTEKAGG